MPFTLIKGTFHVVGYSPDGDSIKFKAKKKSNWKKVAGKKIKPNGKGHVQLRVEGIDSLETHYKPQSFHQPKPLAEQAGDELMKILGIKNVVWTAKHKRVKSADDGVDGYILARETGPYGRPICFLFKGKTTLGDGSEVFADAAMIRKSANFKMLEAGQAYPLFYETLFYDLREEMSKAVASARGAKKGIWKVDHSKDWFNGTDINALQDDLHIVPKLFRRLIDLHVEGKPIKALPDLLAKERVTILPAIHHTDLDEAVEISGNKVRMKYDPENLIVGTVIR